MRNFGFERRSKILSFEMHCGRSKSGMRRTTGFRRTAMVVGIVSIHTLDSQTILDGPDGRCTVQRQVFDRKDISDQVHEYAVGAIVSCIPNSDSKATYRLTGGKGRQ